jgi:hypothetical protein
MAEENYELWYLFENDSNLSSVSISPTENVHDLRKRIHQEWGQGLSKYSDRALALTQVHHIRVSTRTLI